MKAPSDLVKAPSDLVKAELLEAIPNLRAFAISLCGDVIRADDLVQEALLRAWGKISSYEEGTNLKAWLFTILRNNYFSMYRKQRREIEDVQGNVSSRLAVHPEQPGIWTSKIFLSHCRNFQPTSEKH